ncbi:recombinase family protein [Bacillus paramobilis]|uniref:Recombinase family protein n=1 Tax=Bacillus paramobilis TaxID=2817477 RepID=A0ABZ2VNQ4_9BACI
MKVAIYIRVSTEEQAEEGYSIEGQVKTLTDYCKSHAYDIYNTYKDDGYSGKSTDRPALQKLLNDCKNHKFNMIIVWKISRLSRKQLDFLQLMDYFDHNNILFSSVSESIDASTATGKAMMQMMGTFAELERNTIVDNVKMGMKQRAREGKWNGGSMLGYTSKNKQLVIVESEAELVKKIFHLYLDGKGYKAIANQLNHEGHKTKRNVAFSTNSVRTILHNSAYAGYISFNKVTEWSEKRRKGNNQDPIIVKGEHTAIIDENTWQKTQTLLKRKSNKPTKTFTGNFPLTTLLRCPMCGQGMIGHKIRKSANTDEYIRYYQCGNFHYKGSAICKSNLIRADYAEQYVFERLEEIVSDPLILQDIIDNVNKKISKHLQPLKNELKTINEQISSTEKNINRYFNLFETTKIPGDLLANKLESLNQELTQLKSRKQYIEQKLQEPTIKEVSFDKVFDTLSAFSKFLPTLPAEKQKHFLHTLIDRIFVNHSDDIKKRSIKDIILFFDTSSSNNYVLTYDTVPHD